MGNLRKLRTCLVSESIGHFYIVVGVGGVFVKGLGDVNRSCRSWLVLETPEIGLYFVAIDFDL
jgi:hypothetical protein